MAVRRFSLPLWAKFVLALGVGAVLLVALILFVEHNNGNGEARQNPQAVVRANREAETLVAQDQAPHVVRITAHAAPRRAILGAVRADMTKLIAGGTILGTLQRAACRRTGGTHDRQAFACTAVVAGVNYPFLGVVDLPRRTVTYCKRDEPPVPADNVPVSPRCLA